jgi:transmembrane 9 superfamily member 1
MTAMAASPAAAAALLILLALAVAGRVAANVSDHRYRMHEPVPLYGNDVGLFDNLR